MRTCRGVFRTPDTISKTTNPTNGRVFSVSSSVGWLSDFFNNVQFQFSIKFRNQRTSSLGFLNNFRVNPDFLKALRMRILTFNSSYKKPQRTNCFHSIASKEPVDLLKVIWSVLKFFFETYDYGIYQNWFLHFWELWLYTGSCYLIFLKTMVIFVWEQMVVCFDNHPTPMTSLFWILGNKKLGWMEL